MPLLRVHMRYRPAMVIIVVTTRHRYRCVAMPLDIILSFELRHCHALLIAAADVMMIALPLYFFAAIYRRLPFIFDCFSAASLYFIFDYRLLRLMFFFFRHASMPRRHALSFLRFAEMTPCRRFTLLFFLCAMLTPCHFAADYAAP